MRPPELIEDGALVLRRWLIGDAELLQRALSENVEHLRPWMSWMAEEPQDLEHRRAILARWEQEWHDGGDVYLAVILNGQVAGSSGLHRRRGPHTLEIGYWTHVAFLRQGVATRVARLLTNTALAVPGIRSVEIHHDHANAASSHIPQSLGFKMVGETSVGIAAPAESGIDCAWRIMLAEWANAARAPAATLQRSAR